MTGVADARCLLVVAPHPDDEILGCGLLMRRVADAGRRVCIAWTTDGGASHGDLGPAARAALVALRRAEALAGLAVMGIVPAATVFMANPDGGLGDPTRIAATTATLAALCAAHGVDAVAVTSRGDGHPDHRASFAAVRALGGPAAFEYFVSARYDGDAPAPDGAAMLTDDAGARLKRRALACHRSQAPGNGALYPMTAAAVARFCAAPEFFRRIEEHAHG